MRVPERNVAVGLGVGVGAALAGWWAWRRLTTLPYPHTWEEVGEVSELKIYPLKSARGIAVNDAQATIYGLASNLLEDRAFMVINDEGTFITNRQAGILTTVVTQWKGQTLTLKATGFEDVSVDLERDLKHQPIVDINIRGQALRGIDCGDQVAEWLTNVLFKGETKVRLAYKGDVVKDRPSRLPDFHEFKHYRETDRMFYADNSAYMLACQASLDDLNNRLEKPVQMENFRSNIIVKGSSAYDEDDWAYVKIGQVVLRRLKPCERCVSTTISPETGERPADMEPLTTMKKYRSYNNAPSKLTKVWAMKPVFGLVMGLDTSGHIAVGDKVHIARGSVHPHLKGY